MITSIAYQFFFLLDFVLLLSARFPRGPSFLAPLPVPIPSPFSCDILAYEAQLPRGTSTVTALRLRRGRSGLGGKNEANLRSVGHAW